MHVSVPVLDLLRDPDMVAVPEKVGVLNWVRVTEAERDGDPEWVAEKGAVGGERVEEGVRDSERVPVCECKSDGEGLGLALLLHEEVRVARRVTDPERLVVSEVLLDGLMLGEGLPVWE